MTDEEKEHLYEMIEEYGECVRRLTDCGWRGLEGVEEEEFKESERLLKEIRKKLESLRKKSIIEGMRRFAWWKDGVEYVGTCGTTLAQAIEDLEAE